MLYLFYLLLCVAVGDSNTHNSGNSFQAIRPIISTMKENYIDQRSLYLPTKVNPNSTCGMSLEQMKNALEGDQITDAHKWVDSWGKYTSGVLVGVHNVVGDYEECKHTYFHSDTLRGKYCRISVKQYQLEAPPKSHLKWLPRFIPPETQASVEDALNNPPTENGTETVYSTCIPDACTQQNLKDSMIEVFNNTGLEVNYITCHLDFTSDSLEVEDAAFIGVLCFFGFLLILASIADIYIERTDKKHLRNGGLRFLLPFSAYTNIQKLFHMSPESPPGTITCLHGMRVLSMVWVVYAHQTFVNLGLVYNIYNMLLTRMNGVLYQVVLNGYPSVDTFFFMGGFLMTYSVLREFKRTGTFNIVIFYVHRIIRLVPPMALVGGLFATLPLYFMDGPIADYWLYTRRSCQLAWWKDLVFMNNFASANGDPVCLGQVWYVSVDTQIYLITPLILLPLLYKRKMGMVWLYITTMVSVLVPGLITYVNDLAPTSVFGDPKGDELNDLIYMMPWARAGPIVIGIWLGIFIHDQGKNNMKLTPWQVLTGWTLAIGTGLLVVFGLWSYNSPVKRADYDVITAVLYAGLHRSAWAAALAWTVFACHNGYGGFVNDFLSHPIWQPMSRLTYSIYLMALPMQFAIAYHARMPFYFTYYNQIIQTVGALLVAFIPSVLVSIISESPIIGLEKLIFKRSGSSKVTPMPPKDVKKGIDNEAFSDIVEVEEKERSEINSHQMKDIEIATTKF